MLKNLTISLLLATLATSGSPGPTETTTTPERVAATSLVDDLELDSGTRSVSLTPVQIELVDWARERYESAGLDLPDVEVRFDPSRELCHYATGLYEHLDGGHRVTICTTDADTFGAELLTRRTLLHEFGHVWDKSFLAESDRQFFLELFELDAWIDGADPWEQRGIEHFAEVMVHGLLDQSRRQLEVELDCHRASSAFEIVAGRPPLGPGTPWCVAEDTTE